MTYIPPIHRTSKERREAILSLIKENPDAFGPQDIASRMGSTTKSITVSICHLRIEGYRISRCPPGKPVGPGEGYRYLGGPEDADCS